MNDFNFLVGSWDLANRRLKEPLAGSTEWYEMTMPTLGFSGVTLRLYNAKRDEWSLYWISSRRLVLDPPVVGRFEDGVGTFFGDDTHEGRPILVRYLWSKITPTSAHWEQAFSVDGGKTWETNWMNDLTRRA
jgi:hypothetical protein